jgi:protein-S-isoprenylcysteine O-methyltransferase Ste14
VVPIEPTESRLIVKAGVFIIAVPGVVVGLLPSVLLSSGWLAGVFAPGAWRWAGLPLLLAAVPLWLWCAAEFLVTGRGTPSPTDPPRHLVARGPYRRVRNPMYLSAILFLLGAAFLFSSAALLVYSGGLFAGFHAFVVLYEEPTLRRKFGEDYRQYCARTPRWLPRPVRANADG